MLDDLIIPVPWS